MKRFITIALITILFSCKNSKALVKEAEIVQQAVVSVGCILPDLLPLFQYQAKVEEYANIYRDTIIQLQQKLIAKTDYKTYLELKSSERHVWFISKSGQAIDSLLLHTISPSRAIDTDVDLANCRLETNQDTFDPVTGMAESGSTYFTSIPNPNP